MRPSVCKDCGAPKPTRRHTYCSSCSLRHEMRNEGVTTFTALERKRQRVNRLNTAQRGYGTEHRALRRQWKIRVDAHEISCWRCGKPIDPNTPWHLGHDDYDRSVYRGPEHQRCNVGAVSRVQQQKRRQRRWSESWY